MNYTAHYDSPLGGITLASDGRALTGLWFLTSSVFDNKVFGSPSGCDGQKHFGSTLGSLASLPAQLPVFDDTRRWLDIYFTGRAPGFTPPLLMRTSDFRRRVWELMLTIPFGQTMTYGELARRIAAERGMRNMSAQAVGGAVGHNSISLIIPCHRVVGADGSLTGYAGGIDKKMRLLQLEGSCI